MVSMCDHPGCISYAVGGETVCVVHLHSDGAKVCDVCRGSGWIVGPPRLPCTQCAGVGLIDHARHAPRSGSNRRKEPVDQRGLIHASEDRP